MLAYNLEEKAILEMEIRALLADLGTGKVEGVAYDTAWVARLAPRYPNYGFEESIEWLRRNQYEDGSWGAPLVHYHDRFISTLAAIVALREVGDGKKDERRVKRGEDVLWKLVGRLGRDDSDTIGFPILSAGLAEDADSLGLDVPKPPIRFASGYKKKVQALLNQPNRNWKTNPLTVSLEGLRYALTSEDDTLSENHSVGMSPAATAASLMVAQDDYALRYLQDTRDPTFRGASPAFAPLELFEIAWSLNQLRLSGCITPDMPEIKNALDYLWKYWSHKNGISYSRFTKTVDLDDTALTFSVLRWAGYEVSPDVFDYYELEDHFCCYHGETDPSISVHVRLLGAILMCEDHPKYEQRVNKIVNALLRMDDNGSFWSDKWHISPYYVNSFALSTLQGLADDLVFSRFKWIIRTQNDDGGWGYTGPSTPEETAFCLEALLRWDSKMAYVPSEVIEAGVKFLRPHIAGHSYPPMWIGKSLYAPTNLVRATILGALHRYSEKVTA